MTPPPGIHPRDWARMSWHQRARYIEAHPTPPPTPRALTTTERNALRTTMRLLNEALMDTHRAQRKAA